MRPGIRGLSARLDEPLKVFDAPAGTTLLTAETDSLTIIGAGKCVDDTTWWPARTMNGVEGWIQENEGSDYLILPFDDAYSFPIYCPGAAVPRLLTEGEGRVIAGQGANNVRMGEGEAAELLGKIPEGGTFTVLDGPVCADGMLWWQVQSGDLNGWTAEGQGDTYWLEVNR
jgi:hypothetical protein